jgi:hypothetical protein
MAAWRAGLQGRSPPIATNSSKAADPYLARSAAGSVAGVQNENAAARASTRKRRKVMVKARFIKKYP